MKKLAVYLLRFISWLVYISPRSWQMAYGDFLGFLWFDLLKIRRKVVDENIKRAFPDISELERIRIGRESCRGMGRALVEYFLFPHLNQKNIEEFFVCQNWNVYENARREGKGVLVLSLHMGSYDFLSVYLAMKGMDLYLISKEMKNKNMNDLWFGLRSSKGLKFISDRRAKFDIIRALKEKSTVAFIIDQFTGPPIGIATKFFGHATGSPKGLALFHTWTKAPVIPAYNFRRPDNKIEVVFGDPVELEIQGNREDTVAFMTQKYNNILEDIIRQHPEQWLWVHKRWKEFKY